MINEQELISKAVSDRECSEITELIKKNRMSQADDIIDEYEEWHSSDGNSFQTLKTVDDIEYVFEINSDCEPIVLGKLYDLMTDLVIEMSDDCEKDFRKLSEKEQDEVIKTAEHYGELFATDRAEFFKTAHQPVRFRLDGKFDSSLYCFRADGDICIIASVDDDPIFKSVIVTLLSVFKDEDTEKKFGPVAQSFYRHFTDVKQI
jgi:hypothetical protein